MGVAPGWYPDPLEDFPFDLEARRTTPIWVTPSNTTSQTSTVGWRRSGRLALSVTSREATCSTAPAVMTRPCSSRLSRFSTAGLRYSRYRLTIRVSSLLFPPFSANSVIQDRKLLVFWQTFPEARVLNFESGIFHCGSAAPWSLWWACSSLYLVDSVSFSACGGATCGLFSAAAGGPGAGSNSMPRHPTRTRKRKAKSASRRASSHLCPPV